MSGLLQRVSNDGYDSHFNGHTITLYPHTVNVFIGCLAGETILPGLQGPVFPTVLMSGDGEQPGVSSMRKP